MRAMLRLDSDWIWDSWIADDGQLYHLYFLKAPRALEDPGLRHDRATIGHATSADLRTWAYLGETFGPSDSGWDDLAIWTGSTVLGDDGVWRMFYTATNTHGGHGVKDQKIGLATSTDLHHWERVGDAPVLTADPRWYKTLDEDPRASETWRDPFVFRDPGGDGWHLLVTARGRGAWQNDDGVIAHARSADLDHWEPGPPLCDPGHGFGQLEVPQIRVIDDRAVLVFTCHPQEMTEQRRAASGDFCTWSVVGSSVTGKWDISRAQPFTAEPYLFAAPLVQQRDGQWVFVGFRNTEPQGVYAFDIIDPVPVAVVDGTLTTEPVRS
jgi:beta-fructofuranosidase